MFGIEFGRMDYAIVDGRIQVFEINTGPTLLRWTLLKPDQALRRPAVRLISEGLYEAFDNLDSN